MDEQMNYFKVEKQDAVKNLLKNYIEIFNNKKITYPTRMIIWGFPQVVFDNEVEMYGRIKVLSELTSIPINIKFVEEEFEDKTKNIQCYIEVLK